MQSKCSRKNCNFSEEAAHMDEALEKLQQHYRAVHPTKGFYRHREIETLEGYNITPDEFMEGYLLNYDDVAGAAPVYDWRSLRHVVDRQRRAGGPYVLPATIDEVERRLVEAEANQPPPAAVEADVVEAWPVDVAPPVAMPPFRNRVDGGGF